MVRRDAFFSHVGLSSRYDYQNVIIIPKWVLKNIKVTLITRPHTIREEPLRVEFQILIKDSLKKKKRPVSGSL